MKPWKFLFNTFILFFAISTTVHSQVLWRSAKTIPKGTFIVLTSVYYMDFDQSYNPGDKKWVAFSDDKNIINKGFQSMIGFALTDRIEAMIHIPVSFNYSQTRGIGNHSSGVGDIFFKTRIGILKWTRNKHGLTLTGGVRFNTGDADATPSLGDGSFDIALGSIFSSAWIDKWQTHVKANYWFNGKSGKYDIGDEFKFIAKLDRKFSTGITGFLGYIYYSLSKKKENGGTIIYNTEKSRHYIVAGCVYSPGKGLNIRPKIVVPFNGKGGNLFPFKLCLDLWYTFKIFKY
jgi:hypothetical protein